MNGAYIMDFVTVRDFRSSSRSIWNKVNKGSEVVVTNNGKPAALLISIPEGGLEETLADIRQAKAMRSFNKMRQEAVARGFMSDDEINEIIGKARQELRQSADD